MQHSTVSHVFFFSAVVVSFGCGSVLADPSDWAEGTKEHNDGANREHYNQAASLRWAHFMGDWCDAEGTELGEAPYAIAEVSDTDTLKPVRWDVTTLVNEWDKGTHPNQGLFLRVVEGAGRTAFASRENTDKNLHPKLELTGENGTVILNAVADTFLTKSTFRCQGQSPELRVSAEAENLLVRFDLEQASDIGTITNATLLLHSPEQFGSASIGVFRCNQGDTDAPTSPVLGIAAKYENDRGIAKDPDVIFATGFEHADWESEWTQAGPDGKVDTVDPDTGFKGFIPLQGRALRSRIPKGGFTALNTLYKFDEQIGSEPEEIYFRYHLRLADDWNQTVQGGKLPGISGTYGRAGWGGRKSDGTNGWSARGLFQKTIPAGNPLAGTTPVGFYCYHADMKGTYGSHWVWSQGYRGYLTTNHWYTIEQHCRLNTPGEKDGILRAWVDGHLAFEKTDMRFRLTDELKIEQIWMNLYHGGKTASPHDQHIFIDNVVIAKKYIGPMATAP
nr:DNRLRE domain-containing protein [Rhodopirellula sp. UBA1907]|tara:strand:+ start:21555 stop:23066 length:1512 start_codon:yes stop_codon:yes gene_type:complete